MSELNNPMRFSMQGRTVEVADYLDHEDEIDYVQRYVTDIEVRPSEGNIYVHWDTEGLSELQKEMLQDADELIEQMEEDDD